MRLAPGRVLVKPVETAETLNGGRILLTDATRERWTMGQAEVVAVGPPAQCEDDECEREHLDGHHPIDARLIPGAWILCKPRKFVEVPEGYLVMTDDVVGVFTAPSGQTPI